MEDTALVTGPEMDEVLFVGTYEEARGYLCTGLRKGMEAKVDLRACHSDSSTGIVELGRFKSWEC